MIEQNKSSEQAIKSQNDITSRTMYSNRLWGDGPSRPKTVDGNSDRFG